VSNDFLPHINLVGEPTVQELQAHLAIASKSEELLHALLRQYKNLVSDILTKIENLSHDYIEDDRPGLGCYCYCPRCAVSEIERMCREHLD
jgi:hypothetical protein